MILNMLLGTIYHIDEDTEKKLEFFCEKNKIDVKGINLDSQEIKNKITALKLIYGVIHCNENSFIIKSLILFRI